MTHRSKEIEKFLHKSVEITFKDNTKVIGFLDNNSDGRIIPYRISGCNGDYVFYKSHVKSIKEIIFCN